MDEYLYKQKKFGGKLVIGNFGERFVEKYFRIIFDYLLNNKEYRQEYCKTVNINAYPYETNQYEQSVGKIDGLFIKSIDGIPYNVKTRQHGSLWFGDIYFQIGYQYFKNGKKYQKLDVDMKKSSFYYTDLIYKNINIIYLFLDNDEKKVVKGFVIILKNFKKHYPPNIYIKCKNDTIFTYKPFGGAKESYKNKINFGFSIRDALKLTDSFFDITKCIENINNGNVNEELL